MNNATLKSSTWDEDFLTFVNNTENILIKYFNKYIPEEKGVLKVNKRMVYRNGKEIQSVEFSIVYLINQGEWFDETLSFRIYTDEECDFYKLTTLHTYESKLFTKKDILEVAKYIFINLAQYKNDINSFLALTK